ncbi:hypothetical protein [Hymenobacter crusticola]|uniref:Uncharacterized protein n=1 Tax=Hymenobacter crusticola TaxID=1770526 RepID=A0A243W5T4_9BACT|nr:hypothetical protein [Hymenobacter crusticola]OUJ68981.1 hypothetical protein BXP70_27130 [Hymenobacter crusticola]
MPIPKQEDYEVQLQQLFRSNYWDTSFQNCDPESIKNSEIPGILATHPYKGHSFVYLKNFPDRVLNDLSLMPTFLYDTWVEASKELYHFIGSKILEKIKVDAYSYLTKHGNQPNTVALGYHPGRFNTYQALLDYLATQTTVSPGFKHLHTASGTLLIQKATNPELVAVYRIPEQTES